MGGGVARYSIGPNRREIPALNIGRGFFAPEPARWQAKFCISVGLLSFKPQGFPVDSGRRCSPPLLRSHDSHDNGLSWKEGAYGFRAEPQTIRVLRSFVAHQVLSGRNHAPRGRPE